MEHELAPIISGRARLEIVDISDDPVLLRRYGLRIPVLVADEGELSGYPLAADRVREHLGL